MRDCKVLIVHFPKVVPQWEYLQVVHNEKTLSRLMRVQTREIQRKKDCLTFFPRKQSYASGVLNYLELSALLKN